jgi:ferric-dicitrate binding protein FerR (iron transport regulator)
MSTTFNRERLTELAGLLCDDEISQEEVAELESVLKSSPDARQLFHLTVAVHRDLQFCNIEAVDAAKPADQRMASKLAPSDPSIESQPPRVRPAPRRSTAAVVTAVIVLCLAGYLNFRGGDNALDLLGDVTITDLVDVEWADGESRLRVGQNVGKRRLRINAGSIRLAYSDGVVTTLDGPADLELVSDQRAILHQGQLVAFVPDGAQGFRVSTPAAEIIDLGTEFGVTASEDGTSNIIVFDGEVELSPNNKPDAQSQKIAAGLAWQIDREGKGTRAEFRQASFEVPRSLLRRRRIIREPFRSAKSFPGRQRTGWTSPWSLSGLPDDDLANSVHVLAESPLLPGTQNYLTIHAANDLRAAPLRLSLSRAFTSFDQFDVTVPYTVEFCFRLECAPASIRQIRISSAATDRDDIDESMWQVRTVRPSKDSSELQWRVYHPETDSNQFEMLPVAQGQTYRFLIEVDPVVRRWRMTISDGQRTIWNTLRNGDPLRLSSGTVADGGQLRWSVTGKPGSEVKFSLDAIRIQNPPLPAVVASAK